MELEIKDISAYYGKSNKDAKLQINELLKVFYLEDVGKKHYLHS